MSSRGDQADGAQAVIDEALCLHGQATRVRHQSSVQEQEDGDVIAEAVRMHEALKRRSTTGELAKPAKARAADARAADARVAEKEKVAAAWAERIASCAADLPDAAAEEMRNFASGLHTWYMGRMSMYDTKESFRTKQDARHGDRAGFETSMVGEVMRKIAGARAGADAEIAAATAAGVAAVGAETTEAGAEHTAKLLELEEDLETKQSELDAARGSEAAKDAASLAKEEALARTRAEAEGARTELADFRESSAKEVAALLDEHTKALTVQQEHHTATLAEPNGRNDHSSDSDSEVLFIVPQYVDGEAAAYDSEDLG